MRKYLLICLLAFCVFPQASYADVYTVSPSDHNWSASDLKDLRSNAHIVTLLPHSAVISTEDVQNVSDDLIVQKPTLMQVDDAWNSSDDPVINPEAFWAHQMTNTTWAWPQNEGTGVKVAILDTGTNYNLPDFSGRVFLGHDYVDGDNNPLPASGDFHGTGVASVVGAAFDGEGAIGVAPQATLMIYRVGTTAGGINTANAASAVAQAQADGAQVINISFGGETLNTAFRDAIQTAANAGIVVTCASGNEGPKATPHYPSAYPGCVSVGAVDYGQTLNTPSLASFSRYNTTGPEVDVVAPGVTLPVLNETGRLVGGTGTSFAAPYVAGVAALMIAHGATNVATALQSTAWDMNANGSGFASDGSDYATGAGLVSVSNALGLSLPANLHPSSSSAPVAVQTNNTLACQTSPFSEISQQASYTWLRAGQVVGPGPTYTVSSTDNGMSFTCQVKLHNEYAETVLTSAPVIASYATPPTNTNNTNSTTTKGPNTCQSANYRASYGQAVTYYQPLTCLTIPEPDTGIAVRASTTSWKYTPPQGLSGTVRIFYGTAVVQITYTSLADGVNVTAKKVGSRLNLLIRTPAAYTGKKVTVTFIQNKKRVTYKLTIKKPAQSVSYKIGKTKITGLVVSGTGFSKKVTVK